MTTRNSLYNFVGGIVRLGLGIISVPLLLRWFGTETYGLYSILLSIINFSLILEGVLPVILTVFLAGGRAVDYEESTDINVNNVLKIMAWIIASLGTLLVTLVYGLAPTLVSFFDQFSTANQPILLRGIRLASLVVLLRLLQQFFIGIEQANARFKLYNTLNSAFSIAHTAATLAVAFFSHSILLAIVAQIIVSAIFLIIHALYCQRQQLLPAFWLTKGINEELFIKVIKYTGQSSGTLIGSMLFSQGDKIIIGKILGLEAVGIYSALTSIISQINTLSALPVQTIVTEVSQRLANKVGIANRHAESYDPHLQLIVQRSFKINSAIAIGLGSSLLLLTPEIVIYLIDDLLQKNTLIIGMMSLIIIYTLYSLNAVGYYMLFALHRADINTNVVLTAGITSLLLIGFFGHHIGLLGALLGNVGYLITLYLLHRGLKIIGIRPYPIVSALWPSVLCLPMSTVASLYVDNLLVRLTILFLLMLYFGSTLLHFYFPNSFTITNESQK